MDQKLLKYKPLIDLTRTTDDLAEFGDEIDTLLQSLYHVEIYNFEDTLEKHVRVRVAKEISKLIHSNSISEKEEIKKFFSDVKHTINALPLLRLALAFEPSEIVLSNLSFWARGNIEPGILIDISMDRSLLGGAVIVYKSRLYDFSLKKKLEEIFQRGDLKL